MKKKKKRWPRNEAMYNQIQKNEFVSFIDYIEFLRNKVCKSARMKRMITCLIIWHKFPNLSARRAESFLLFLKRFGVLGFTIPCFKTLSNYREDNSMQSILDELITESSKPLSAIEHDFGTDSTGIKTKLFSTWYSLRIKKKIRKRDHITVHASMGIKSMTVTALNIETKQGKDNIIFQEHVDKTNENFDIDEWSGDGMYWAKKNCKKIAEVGGKPYFKCKTGKTAWNGKQSGVLAWKEMNTEEKENKEEYDKHYHKRSKLESGNHSKKALHGDKVYSKLKSARINEETLRWVNHNINVLNRAKQEWGINPLED